MTFSRRDEILNSDRAKNQKMRTREALLAAALDLARHGHSPSIAEVAEAAKVSTATAYRYFPNPQSLWSDMATRQAGTTGGVPDFLDDLPEDPEQRIDRVVREVCAFQFADEVVWRGVLRATLDRWFSQVDVAEAERVPVRGVTRLEMARVALAPLRDTLSAERMERLVNAVTLVFGIEALVSTRDTCGLDVAAATETMSWAARSLVRAALAESGADQPSVE
ncbi:TetR/AcrR family transcriptional regulator [Nocardia suismassiliense]|uniref:TetR/AcrR family transcriptional regulator n=1 Tax=Nocardia suismassiliense TaxID=2077092 RepID=UPI000D1EC37A|nr:TetR family transcriptional regulator [Nocardia suismassiliense]